MANEYGREVIDAVAAEFVRSLKEDLGPQTFEEIRLTNRDRADPLTCASHDYVDANVYMETAINEVLPVMIPDWDGWPEGEMPAELVDLWNAAWSAAMPALTAPPTPRLTRRAVEARMRKELRPVLVERLIIGGRTVKASVAIPRRCHIWSLYQPHWPDGMAQAYHLIWAAHFRRAITMPSRMPHHCAYGKTRDELIALARGQIIAARATRLRAGVA